jgi:hypothetical protein
MLIEAELLGAGTRLATGVLGGAALALAAISAPWRVWLGDRERQWVWLGSLALLVGRAKGAQEGEASLMLPVVLKRLHESGPLETS